MSVDAELSTPSLSVGVIGYGARISYIRAPDRHGNWADVAKGFDDPAAWRADPTFQGATIGRYANRINRGTFELDGRRFHVPLNDGANALHGGPGGFSDRDWEVEPPVVTPHESSVTMRRTSPDGEMGFPGNLDVSVVFSVTGSELTIDYRAITDAPTPVNLTNHVYLNLAGRPSSIADHEVTLFADRVAEIGPGLISTGGLIDVAGTPLDFRTPAPIGERWRASHPQMVLAGGYDHAYLLDSSGGEYDGLRLGARVIEPSTGRCLELFTDQPTVQFYSGNMLTGTVVERSGSTLRQSDAFCLEPQQLSDSVNQPHFPSTVLRPGAEYRNRTIYRFSAE
ncbi:aldose 1-epimerase [Nakamurella panacisegetis]|uniref:Aldose 1-epimerase n=1 Tax=Nakamurella panacisegetis TaxID=1090615 RepID=A0A1H0LUX1_9ACTN|nr:aldose epimerase family protein [Nakamurella panacisegetis]SDO71841.1 aldose 1-epimerase [Nakamurella panacisegetis]